MDSPQTTQPQWPDLFRVDNTSNGTVNACWRVLRKRGEPFLVMPQAKSAALESLELYPAQSAKGRLAKNVLRWSLKFNLPSPCERLSFNANPFGQFLQQCAGTKDFPQIGILCGNPHTKGRRFVLLVFGEQTEPRCVVKAGIGPAAIELIEREKTFLRSVQIATVGIPKLLGEFVDENLSAFAMEFLAGESPSADDEILVEKILNGWVCDETVPLSENSAWRQLETIAPHLHRLGKLQKPVVRRVIAHGDFAPWNMKVDRQSGRCVVFDWERGQLPGVPGWDWFHFVIQTGVLVKKLSVSTLRDEIEQLLASGRFSAYAEKCQVSRFKKTLAMMYLLYVEQIIQPSEGGDKISALLQLLLASWKDDLKS